MTKRKILVVSGAMAGLIACWGDFTALFIGGSRYPGYNHLTDTWSSLGASLSPVSDGMSLYWVITGILFIWFAVGFRFAFSPADSSVRMAALLIFLYGLGEGAGSGLFKADHVGDSLTFAAEIHNLVGGIGVLALLILPLVMPKIIPDSKFAGFHTLSRLIFIAGCLWLLLFLSRYLPYKESFFVRYKGLWQRLFVLNNYLYLTVIALRIIRNECSKNVFAGNKHQ